jgi:hypothetical protein
VALVYRADRSLPEGGFATVADVRCLEVRQYVWDKSLVPRLFPFELSREVRWHRQGLLDRGKVYGFRLFDGRRFFRLQHAPTPR